MAFDVIRTQYQQFCISLLKTVNTIKKRIITYPLFLFRL